MFYDYIIFPEYTARIVARNVHFVQNSVRPYEANASGKYKTGKAMGLAFAMTAGRHCRSIAVGPVHQSCDQAQKPWGCFQVHL